MSTGPYRAEHGAIHHRDMGPGFLFTVDPPALAEALAGDLNQRVALLAEREKPCPRCASIDRHQAEGAAAKALIQKHGFPLPGESA
jgi:hypothetical protein